ncbi:MAG: AI-2E family transporter [Gemmataceae bacterium]|nr:AI-2E family transporter [Gemmataceae bacterium]
MSDQSMPTKEGLFQRRLTIATLSLLLVVLSIHLLQSFGDILKPLLIAGLIAYAILPLHRWLVRLGMRASVAYVVLVGILLAAFLFLGQAIYGSLSSLSTDQLNQYKARLDALTRRSIELAESLGLSGAGERLNQLIRDFTFTSDDFVRLARSLVEYFFNFVTFAFVVFIYLIFLLAEKISFPRRMALAFGDVRAHDIGRIAQSINEAIVDYIAVKTWVSLLTGVLSLIPLVMLGIDFALLWALLFFLLNYIPYLGSLVAMAPPVLLAFLGSDSFWPGVVLIVLLTLIQIVIGQVIEPRMAGSRLNLSPLLILLSLAFWGSLWGIPGMLLAVPLTVVCKIVLDHIEETRPIGTLMSNL